jgi:hypothetical protein
MDLAFNAEWIGGSVGPMIYAEKISICPLGNPTLILWSSILYLTYYSDWAIKVMYVYKKDLCKFAMNKISVVIQMFQIN